MRSETKLTCRWVEKTKCKNHFSCVSLKKYTERLALSSVLYNIHDIERVLSSSWVEKFSWIQFQFIRRIGKHSSERMRHSVRLLSICIDILSLKHTFGIYVPLRQTIQTEGVFQWLCCAAALLFVSIVLMMYRYWFIENAFHNKSITSPLQWRASSS